MSDKEKLLIQLDSDLQPSVFDRVVAIDAGSDHIFSYGGVRPEQVQGMVHGAIFTRKTSDLCRTAIFIGGSDVSAGEMLLTETLKHMIPSFGLRVSVMLDSNGANTTAAAAVRAASRHIDLLGTQAIVLGGTGPVGQRASLLLARSGAKVRLTSRNVSKAASAVASIQKRVPNSQITPWGVQNDEELLKALEGQTVVIAAGAAGVILLSQAVRKNSSTIKVAIDLNAVPPLGLEGIEVTDKGKERDGIIGYGALGVGDTKMKLHRLAVSRLFERNDLTLDAEEIYALAQTLP